MPKILPQTLSNALDLTERDLASPNLRPRDEEEMMERIEFYIGQASLRVPDRIYVPDAEAPITPEDKDLHISGPLSLVDAQTRALSTRAKALVIGLLGLVSETKAITSGLSSSVATASARLASVKTLVGSARLSWMRVTDRFLDLSHIDPSLSTSIIVDTKTGNGVCIAPVSDQDLTREIKSLSLISSRSGRGIPGDNMELSSLQGVPGASSPAAGSYDGLTTARQNAGSSGGTGQEPTVSYAGVPDLHASLSAVVSPQPEAWFDWEVLYVPPTQKCSQHGTAYVADQSTGSLVDIIDVTKNYGWNATVQESDGSTRPEKLAYFSALPPITGRDGPTSTLQLALEIDMGQPVSLNQLGVTVLQSGGLWSNIVGVDVSLDHNQWHPLRCQGGALTWEGAARATASTSAAINSGKNTTPATGDSVRGTSLWEIPTYSSVDPSVGLPQFRYASITFQQPDAYSCPKGIGHPYYTKVTKTTKDSKALFGLVHHHGENTVTERLATPDQLINLNVGLLSETKNNTGKAIGDVLGTAATIGLGATFGGPLAAAFGGIGPLVSGVVSGLIGSSSKKIEILQEGEYSDVFQAYRQVISVGQIQPLARTYSTTIPGQLVSPPFSFGHPFSAIRMLVNHREGHGTTIIYDISVDDGKTWLPIVPFDLGQPPAPSLSGSPFHTVNLEGTYNSVRYRATLSTTQAHTAPRILEIALEALPV